MRTLPIRALGACALLAAASTSACVADTTGSVSDDLTAIPKPKRWAPDQNKSTTTNFALWSEYCVGDADVTVRPTPNYDNDEVMEAAVQLSRVSSHSFALYSDVNGQHKTTLAASVKGVSKLAHEFLGYLCGEFRDRASMVQAKVRWVRQMNFLDDVPGAPFDPAGDPWKQMKQADYEPYLALSSALFSAKKSKLVQAGKQFMKVGSLNVDTPVPPQTICETKYMFAEYVKKKKTFDGSAKFDAGYATFRTKSCTLPNDENFYYDFRGDSNIKPNSPESNGMIWFSRTMARQCDSRVGAPPYQSARPESSISSDACRQYFKYPFNHRWNSARAGLASWILLDPTGPGLDSTSQFTVLPRFVGDNDYIFGDHGAYRATTVDGPAELLTGWETKFNLAGLGLSDLLGFDKEKIHSAIQLAVDRHTDWYASGYDDEMDFKPLSNDQAYSPFVASSYEMSESDNFVTPGLTVPVIDPSSRDHKHWMFIFRVAKKNWFTPETIVNQSKPVPSFDRAWFDETSFGETGLADSEKAWDRLGTALEPELDALLYLHNIPSF